MISVGVDRLKVTDEDVPSIVRNERTSRFELVDSPERAHLDYTLSGRRLTLVHTEVADEFEGQGIGSALVGTALTHAAEDGLVVVPDCPFVAGWLDRHPEQAARLAIAEP